MQGSALDTIDRAVLVLNQDYQPVNVCRVRRAVVLLLRGKAEMVQDGLGEIHSADCALPIPSVIHLTYMVRRPYLDKKLTRIEVFNRDHYTCQYCGKKTNELTLDHVIPRHRGGEHAWENVVSCCPPCNHHKAGRSPWEAGMPLLGKPRKPKVGGFRVPYQYLKAYSEWQRFLA